MKCGIVTPVGPGHEDAYQRCAISVDLAVKNSMGPFTSVVKIPVYDLEGKSGRSAARNLGIEKANELGCDWIFFLDADDLMFDDAFKNITHLVDHYDAIWGLICEAPHRNLDEVKLRPHQLISTTVISDILNVDPYLTLQMGHFIKTPLALEIKFDTDLNTGEDFKFYLACWSKYKCIKHNVILFVNVRGNHSTGPRSADGRQWRIEVEKQIRETRAVMASALNNRATVPEVGVPSVV